MANRVGRFLALVVMVFVVAVVGVVAARLSAESVAMLVGGLAVLGVLVVLLVFVLAALWIYWRVRPRRDQYQIPPIVIQSPQQQPQFPYPYYENDPLRSLVSPRRFEVLGDDGKNVG